VRVLRPVVGAVPCAEAADLLGAPRSATRLYRARDGDLVTLRVPTPTGTTEVRMRRRNGDDQVARGVGEGGLWGFEPPLPALFVELARRSHGAVVDVGANTGLYSLLAVAANPTVRVHAVEASPAVAAFLGENLAINRLLARRVEVHRCAVSDQTGTATLYLPPPSGSTVETSASLDPTFKEEVASTVDVAAVTLDDLWESTGGSPVGLVKVDTEGTEHLVLRGAARLLERSRPVTVCEVLPRAATGELATWLSGAGYLDVRLRPDSLVVSPAVAFDPDAWNHAFVPTERLESFQSSARAIGLELRDAHDG